MVLLDGEGKISEWGEKGFIQVLDSKLLPDLSNNIKCGNSLVGTDFYVSDLSKRLDKEIQYKVNAFDYNKEFPDVFNDGGFEIVIGNPPYGFSIDTNMREYIKNKLGKVPDYEFYYCFIQLSNLLLKKEGIVSFIIPNTWLFNLHAKDFRLELFNRWEIIELLDCSKFDIFVGANVKNSIFCFKKNANSKNKIIGYKQTKNIFSFNQLISQNESFTSKDDLIQMITNWALVFQLDPATINIVNKMHNNAKPLSEYFDEVSQGLIAYDKYRGQTESIIKNRVYHYDKYKKGLKKCLWGEDVKKYIVIWNGREWIDYCDGIANPRQPKFFKGTRILVREITNPSIYAAIVDEEMYNDPSAIIILNSERYSLKALLLILNSKLGTFYHFNHSPKATKGSFPKILVQDIKDFPLPKMNDNQVAEINLLADRMIEAVKNFNSVTNDRDKKIANDIINAIDIKINEKVYALYGLNKKEIEIIEKI